MHLPKASMATACALVSHNVLSHFAGVVLATFANVRHALRISIRPVIDREVHMVLEVHDANASENNDFKLVDDRLGEKCGDVLHDVGVQSKL